LRTRTPTSTGRSTPWKRRYAPSPDAPRWRSRATTECPLRGAATDAASRSPRR
jgi:hypothetical protein